MKKQILIILFFVFVLLLSSCSLIKCQHKNYSEQIVAATCTSEGYTVHTCEKCGESYTDNKVAALGHNYTDAVITPNCFEEGYTKHTCTACGDSYNDSSVAKTQHYFVGESCPNCDMEEITENITPDIEWYSEEVVVFDLTTKEQLAGLASLVNEGTDFDGVIIYLDADIDLGFYEWIPIGNSSYSFNGTFDGDGHTISGLKINANSDYVGLFGNVSGKVCNVNIDQANVFVKRDHNYVSILCGYSTGEIVDITTNGFIEAPKSNYVGAIAGAVAPQSIIYSNLINSATINASNYVGGIFGHVNSTGSVQTDNINNTGDVTGIAQVGGIVGYAKATVGSKIYDATVCADIVGEYYVGGIAGKVENITITTCTNDGSTVTANSYYTEGESFYAWLGGYVGYGYSVDNCVNNVDITYIARGVYVGGIAGYLTNNISNCENNGDITTYTDCVGGIVGMINCNSRYELSGLTNNGDISGKNAVGGIAGRYSLLINESASEWYADDHKSGYCNYYKHENGGYNHHKYCLSIKIDNFSNCGKIVAQEAKVGGIVGEFSISNEHYWDNQRCCHGTGYCTLRCLRLSDVKLIATNVNNNNEVAGKSEVGEIFGSFASDAPSTLTTYTVTGKVTVNGEILEGEYDVGSNSTITLSGREIFGAESTDPENPENTETTE